MSCQGETCMAQHRNRGCRGNRNLAAAKTNTNPPDCKSCDKTSLQVSADGLCFDCLEEARNTVQSNYESTMLYLDIDSLNRGRRELQEENERLSKDVKDLERFRDLRARHGDEMQRRTTQLANSEAENARLQVALSSAIVEGSKRIESLRAENEGLRVDLQRRRNTHNETERQMHRQFRAKIDEQYKRANAWKLAADDNDLMSIGDATASCEQAGRLLKAARELEQEPGPEPECQDFKADYSEAFDPKRKA